ncbi:UDP-N-acetylglucosamine--LPS N-acetylglucosamine transferase [Pseudoalteromonas sp. FUC4]|uniref:UDP-N-acetylglucosamine--LPS N-acetylglucosamine transferase n=1 Tax=Pseudoalteromonas sp. FUC4 TaxID=2511201 RepID=UPI0011F28323|nr:UDP-N-acetylglucosamine--LPS N-acetylglucosamine transferase [Pseudoalteromonas sp. FUC4]KAA1155055.1 UDP-N-acetylglucosamine--LPS N-acetylglucosamine transferase [Pseudoalteromonas sp. FUC4]
MKKKLVMAIASRGGHWIQLNRLSAVWEEQDVIFITNDPSLESHVGNAKFETVIDANMDKKLKLIFLAAQTFFKVLKHRPDVIISTGAAPGFFALIWGKLIGAKTVWVDSVANADELSLAGKKVSKIADVWLTQWPEVAKEDGPLYKGRVF